MDWVQETKKRVAEAKARAVDQPTLLAYDANGIQAFLNASNALPYLRGASKVIKDFDEVQRKAGALFAGGGRGLFLVSEAAVEALKEALQTRYQKETEGSLSVATAPYDPEKESASLAWLRANLNAAKDQAPPPVVHNSFTERCPDCKVRPAERKVNRGSDSLKVCQICASVIQVGFLEAKGEHENGKSLSDLSLTNRLAVLAADGNDMGNFFSSLDTLEAQALASRAVSDAFEEGRRRALDQVGMDPKTYVAPVAGGDDIAIFFGPEYFFELVPALAQCLEDEVLKRAQALEGHLRAEQLKHFRKIGLGMGVVIGPDTFPASRLRSAAGALERSAKKICGSQNGARSAVDFALLTAGTEELGSRAVRLSSFTGETDDWATLEAKAKDLQKVPSSQRAQLRDAQIRLSDRESKDKDTPKKASQGTKDGGRDPEQREVDPEAMNLFRYQVARSKEWQACLPNWRDPTKLKMPSVAELDLAQLKDLIERQARKERR